MPLYDLTITRITNLHDTTTASWAMPRFVHRSVNGLVYMASGSITYHFGQTDQTAGPGDTLIFPQGLYYCGNKNTPVQHFYVIDFETDPEDGLERLHLPRILRAGEGIGRLFSQCAQAWQQGRLQSPLRCRGYAYEILAGLTALANQGGKRSALLEDIVPYLRQHYMNPQLNVETLSQRFHISDSQLRRLFQRELGVSPLQYILNLRLELAQNLLRHECLPVQEVAARCGFSSEFYFSRLFKQRLGMPPSAFR